MKLELTSSSAPPRKIKARTVTLLQPVFQEKEDETGRGDWDRRGNLANNPEVEEGKAGAEGAD